MNRHIILYIDVRVCVCVFFFCVLRWYPRLNSVAYQCLHSKCAIYMVFSLRMSCYNITLSHAAARMSQHHASMSHVSAMSRYNISMSHASAMSQYNISMSHASEHRRSMSQVSASVAASLIDVAGFSNVAASPIDVARFNNVAGSHMDVACL